MNPDDIVWNRSWKDLVMKMVDKSKNGDYNESKFITECVTEWRDALDRIKEEEECDKDMEYWSNPDDEYNEFADDYEPHENGWDEEEEEPDHSWDSGLPTPPRTGGWDIDMLPPRPIRPVVPAPRPQQPKRVVVDDFNDTADDEYLRRLGVK